MNNYRVSFYQDILNSAGHRFKCLQRQVDVQSDGPSRALVLAERLIDDERLNVDCIEVVRLAGVPSSTEHTSNHLTPPCKHIWNHTP
jgi:hypothetical protein